MKIIADMHTHTVASTHAYSTVKEMTEAARDAGLEFLAITDHTPNSTDGPHIWHFHNLHKAIPRELFGVKIIYGAESSVTDFEGHIDLPAEECKALDWIIGSVHTDILPSGTVEQNTNAYLGLAKDPLVDVIGHPGNTKFLFDYEKGIRAFKEYDKLVEINESTLLWKNSEKNYREIIPLCKKYEVSVIVNTDAHFFAAVGQVSRSLALLREFDYPERLIVNADRELLLERINRKNGIIFS
ncbi:MAG: phosphatase [Huintestinicola sp.]|uniref:phosphatase n=1 Tax=Huintestinicola sp. TaxID=2981661 RepID=UPI003F101826